MVESTSGKVEIKGVEYSVFLRVLEYIYSYSITSTTPKEDIQLLIVADQYQILELKSFCEFRLQNHVNAQNFAEFYEISTTYNAKKLEISCVRWLLENINSFGVEGILCDITPMKDKFAMTLKE
eukprot:TRINITY_DN8491_c0_g1_i5.p1 TRINITY_DN8491_c0_g1~~TRINITY_DN8491_c0_g1_i5.p1  ORF type:complete len:124 (+),score=36.82 TRINITY_DN8491_c0_g1_i5:283-654(+)